MGDHKQIRFADILKRKTPAYNMSFPVFVKANMKKCAFSGNGKYRRWDFTTVSGIQQGFAIPGFLRMQPLIVLTQAVYLESIRGLFHSF